MMSQQKKYEESRIKSNVRGDGIDRKELPNFLYIGNIGSDFINKVKHIIRTYPEFINEINTESYAVSSKCNRKFYPDEYRQILFQDYSSDNTSETNYVSDRYPSIINAIKSYISNPYRTRISFLPSGMELDWHIDTNTSVSCRYIIPIDGPSGIFSVKRDGEIDSKRMKQGEIWFMNTGFPHHVINDGETTRTVLLFGSHSDNLIPYIGTSND